MIDKNIRMQNFLRRFRTAVRYGRENGLRPLIILIRQKMRGDKRGGVFSKIDVIGFYDFVKYRPLGASLAPGDVAPKTLNWIIPPYGFGSGGHLNIFRFIYFLEKFGFDCRIIVEGYPRPVSAVQARKQITEWFFPVSAKVYIGIEDAPPADITIATNWITAYHVRNFQPTNHRCYFVQDFEPLFYAQGSEYAWAEETYRFGFMGITAGSWLEKKLSDEYGMDTRAFGFSYDHERYKPVARRDSTVRRVFFYARPPTARRAFELGLLVLDEVVRRLSDVEVIFAGWDISGYDIPFRHHNGGVLSLDELPDLYGQCDVALVLSFSNLSLLPLELMACGTPVVSNRGPYTEWLLNDQNSCLADPTVEALADALCAVLNNPAEMQRLRTAGFSTAASTNWEREARLVGDMLEMLGEQGKKND